MDTSPPKLKQSLGGSGCARLVPGEEVELSDGAGLSRTHVLEIEGAHQIVVTPDVFRHQVHLDEVEGSICQRAAEALP